MVINGREMMQTMMTVLQFQSDTAAVWSQVLCHCSQGCLSRESSWSYWPVTGLALQMSKAAAMDLLAIQAASNADEQGRQPRILPQEA